MKNKELHIGGLQVLRYEDAKSNGRVNVVKLAIKVCCCISYQREISIINLRKYVYPGSKFINKIYYVSRISIFPNVSK